MESTSQPDFEVHADPVSEDAAETVEDAAPQPSEAAERDVHVDNTRVSDDPKEDAESAQVDGPVPDQATEPMADQASELTALPQAEEPIEAPAKSTPDAVPEQNETTVAEHVEETTVDTPADPVATPAPQPAEDATDQVSEETIPVVGQIESAPVHNTLQATEEEPNSAPEQIPNDEVVPRGAIKAVNDTLVGEVERSVTTETSVEEKAVDILDSEGAEQLIVVE